MLIQGSGPSDAAQAQVDGILKKLEMNLPGSKVKNMGGGVVIDLEHNDDYGKSIKHIVAIKLPCGCGVAVIKARAFRL